MKRHARAVTNHVPVAQARSTKNAVAPRPAFKSVDPATDEHGLAQIQDANLIIDPCESVEICGLIFLVLLRGLLFVFLESNPCLSVQISVAKFL